MINYYSCNHPSKMKQQQQHQQPKKAVLIDKPLSVIEEDDKSSCSTLLVEASRTHSNMESRTNTNNTNKSQMSDTVIINTTSITQFKDIIHKQCYDRLATISDSSSLSIDNLFTDNLFTDTILELFQLNAINTNTKNPNPTVLSLSWFMMICKTTILPSITDNECTMIFDIIDIYDMDPLTPYVFIRGLIPSLNTQRMGYVKSKYDMLYSDSIGENIHIEDLDCSKHKNHLTVVDIKKRYGYEKYHDNTVTYSYSCNSSVENSSVENNTFFHKNTTGFITYDEFVEYYTFMSANTVGDDEFNAMIQNDWNGICHKYIHNVF